VTTVQVLYGKTRVVAVKSFIAKEHFIIKIKQKIETVTVAI